MNKFQIEENIIFECVSGSNLYGFATTESDLDKRGIFIPFKDYVLGLKNIEQYEDPNEDRIIYSIYKFFKLSIASNPNIIELLYVPDEKIIHISPVWEKVRENAHLFLSKKARYSFSGYAHAQLKRIHTHKKWISDPAETPPKKEDFINVMTLKAGEEAQFIQSGWDEITLVDAWGVSGDLKDERVARLEYFRKDEYEAALKKHKQYLEWKKNRNPDRAKLEASYGYDGKHASHLIRLLKMAVEIFEEGMINVDRSKAGDAQFYLDIRNGKYSYDELIEMADELENKIEKFYNTSDLRNSPDVNKINNLLIEIYEEFYDYN